MSDPVAGGDRTSTTQKMKQSFRTTLRLAACVAATLALLLLASATTAQAATLVSDKDDYVPGETAYLLGAGFEPGEAVAITLAVHTCDGTILDYAVGGIIADTEGSLTATWLVPQEAADTWIEATAMGLQSSLVAVATFTDSVSSALVTSPTKDQPITITSLPATVTVSFTYSSGPAGFTTTAEVSVPGVGKWTKDVTTGGTADAPLSESIDVTIPENTANDPYNVQLTVNNEGPGGSKTKNDNQQGAIIVNIATPQPTCPVNQAPTIRASDYVVSEVCAVWNGEALTVTVPVAPENFSPIEKNDPDGDPVTVTIDVTEVTLTGLGEVQAEVILTATDDPSARNIDGCPSLVPLTATTTVQVKAALTFNFVGFAAPLDNATARKVKNGSTVPVKFQLTDCAGNYICSTLKPNWIWVGLQSQVAPEGGVEVNDSGAANDNGTKFRYSGACDASGNWIYNLSTKTGYTVGNTYKITAGLADETTHDVLISISK
jgi:hypothetical protein